MANEITILTQMSRQHATKTGDNHTTRAAVHAGLKLKISWRQPRYRQRYSYTFSGSSTTPKRQFSHHCPGCPDPAHGIGPLTVNSFFAVSGMDSHARNNTGFAKHLHVTSATCRGCFCLKRERGITTKSTEVAGEAFSTLDTGLAATR